MDKKYVVKMKTANGKTRYYCYDNGSGFNTTFFIDSAAKLTKDEAKEKILNFNNAVISLFDKEIKNKEKPEDNEYAELEKFWGKNKPSKHDVISYEIKNIIKSLSRINEFLTK